jgi:glycosyltransferase involved in cell wall biosynthesis
LGFSVIVPTRNRLGTLPRAVDSVLAQTFEDFELIIIDDASTDGTRDYVAGLGDERIRYFASPQPLGASGARNAGMNMAERTLIAFLDSDDEWLPAKLARNWELAHTIPDGSEFIGFNAIEVRTEEGWWREPRRGPQQAEPVAEYILRGGGFIQTSSVFGTRSLLARTGFDGRMQPLEDWDLYIRATQGGAQLLYQPDVLTVHHADLRADRISRGVSTHDVDVWLEAHGHMLSPQSRAVFDLVRVAPALKAGGHGWQARTLATSSYVVRGVDKSLFLRPFAAIMLGPAPRWLAPYTRRRRMEHA